jgi:hypothetical protein
VPAEPRYIGAGVLGSLNEQRSLVDLDLAAIKSDL